MAKLRWSDEAKRYQFYQGLNDKIKDRLIDLEPAKTWLRACHVSENGFGRENKKREDSLISDPLKEERKIFKPNSDETNNSITEDRRKTSMV